MNLQDHYTQLWKSAEARFAAGDFALDPLIDSPNDTRRGLTLLARPSPAVKKEMQYLLQHLSLVEPEQYYYPASDIHLTVLSLISCYPDFTLESVQLPPYIDLLKKALEPISRFNIHYSGLTASPSCVLVQGFPRSNELEELRDRVRQAFRSSDLQESIDQRYTIQTAHSTIVRFRKPLSQPGLFLQKLRECRHRNFGTSPINTLELVYHDWYQRQETTHLLATFPLK
ncbi:2'-5' RNA ligase family protein [Rufibacter latericius]|uniref:Mutarotase n=1 Tax=Rufibacter latericius TaxID=2487040 RepID=A0A3M9MDE9_9BACT|nr:mutarotase [Rufibacter latericius]RNI23576.1 mutarotase [Rufibacter latericius]